MLTCRNCGHLNEETALICVQCQMKGKFEWVEKEQQVTTILPKQNAFDNCWNCGEKIDTTELRCPHCQILQQRKYDLLSNNTLFTFNPVRNRFSINNNF